MKWATLACALVVVGAGERVFGITAYSAGDPSLVGVTVAEVDGGLLYPIGGAPPVGPVPPYASVDERVVRNGGGTLDFYYRFSGVAGEYGGGLAVDWIELQTLPSSTNLALGYLADSAGTVAPTDGATGPAGPPDERTGQYAAFGFDTSGQGVTLDTTGSKWLLLRTDATSFGTGMMYLVPMPEEVVALPGETPGVGGVFPQSAPIFIPAEGGAVPEPGSLMLVMLGVGGMWLRRGRVWG